MKASLFLTRFVAAALLLAAASCKKDPPPQAESPGGPTLVEDRDGFSTGTQIGQKRANPYKTETIRQAYNNLYEPDIQTLLPNHLYIRFLPQTPQDVKALLETGLDFWDFPLDHDIISIGER